MAAIEINDFSIPKKKNKFNKDGQKQIHFYFQTTAFIQQFCSDVE